MKRHYAKMALIICSLVAFVYVLVVGLFTFVKVDGINKQMEESIEVEADGDIVLIVDNGYSYYITGLICDTSTDIYFDFDAHYNYSNYDETITSENAEELYLAHPSDQWEHYLYGYRFVTFIYEEYGPDAYLDVLEAATAGENPNDEFNTWEFNYCMEAEDTVQYLEQVLGENVFEEFGDWMEVNNDRFEHPENYNWRSKDAATMPETTVETTLERS